MANQIRLKRASGSDPGASDLVLGEPAVRTDTGEIFLKKDDGSIAKVAGGIEDGDKGDITVSNDGGTFTIDNGVISTAKIADDAVNFDKIAHIPTARIVGRSTSGTGTLEAMSASTARTLLNVEDGATADQTASEILTLIKTVDGSGSGLDADTLDGISSASFLRSDADDTLAASLTCRAITPQTDSTFNIGSNSTRFANIYADTLYGDGSNLTNLPSQTDNNFTTTLKNKLDGIASGATNVTNTNQLTNGAGFLTSVGTSNISDNAVTFAKLENIAQNRIIGRTASGTGDPTTLTAANVRSMINVEDGATADQSASEILTLIKTVDGAGSGLDADTLDGISSASFLRSDADDDFSGRLTFSDNDQYPINVHGNHDGKIVLQGSNNPYITFRESTTDKAYFQWHSSGYIDIQNAESGETLRVQSGTSGLKFGVDGTFYNVFHQGNDGSGSGLDADSVDGIAGSSLLRSDTADTASGDITFSGGAGAATIAANSDIRFTTGTWTGEHAGKIQHHQNIFYIQGGSSGIQLRGSDGGSMALFQNTSTILYDDVNFQGGAGAATIAANSDIRFTNGNWTGNSCKIQQHGNALYIQGGSNSSYNIIFRANSGTDRLYMNASGDLYPATDSAIDLGSSSKRFQVGYFDELDSAEVRVNNGILETKAAIATSHTLTADYNALAVSPTINNGVTVTVPSGAVWAIV